MFGSENLRSGKDFKAGEFIWIWLSGDEADSQIAAPAGWRYWWLESIGPKWVYLREAFGLQRHFRLRRKDWDNSVAGDNWPDVKRPSRALVEQAYEIAKVYSAYPPSEAVHERMVSEAQ